jgi:hypothetical protein
MLAKILKLTDLFDNAVKRLTLHSLKGNDRMENFNNKLKKIFKKSNKKLYLNKWKQLILNEKEVCFC